MFKIAFIAVDGEEREVVIAADRESDAVKTVAERDDFDLILTCERLPADPPLMAITQSYNAAM
ncbi:MAG: hypothetical protein NT159_12360 [Proteobacteria bacterium]|nr:hypothetical protein [Pseudomonadota bacterium]